MNTNITFRHLDPTEALKDHVHERLTRLDNIDLKATDVHVVLSLENYLKIAEITVHAKNFRTHASEKSEDMYNSIDRAVDKVEKTLRRHKDKNKGGSKAHSAA